MPRDPLLSLAKNELVEQFPNPVDALAEPDGLLAAGGDLDVGTLLDAYKRGIFPWFSEGQPILWWCPSVRSVIRPGQVKISRSMKKTLRQHTMEISFDKHFEDVVVSCAAPRAKQADTWITPSMREAYSLLHNNGHAHSVECSLNGKLVGGLYGVAVGGAFFGESMVRRENDASKIALICLSDALLKWGYGLIDCQIHNPHLASMGAKEISRQEFLTILEGLIGKSPSLDAWQQI